MAIQNETIQNLFKDLYIDAEFTSLTLEALAAAEHKYLKDLKLNIGAALNKNTAISKKEAALLALAAAVNEKCEVLVKAFTELSKANEANDTEIAEMHAMASLMNANNVLYRFRHYMHTNPNYGNIPAGLRMSIMMNPATGKEFFELGSLMISALNNCELCITSHEASVRQHGATEQRVFEAIRIASVIKSFIAVL